MIEDLLFGHHPQPPKPPSHEPWILVLIGLAIATLLTAGYVGFMYLVERANQ